MKEAGTAWICVCGKQAGVPLIQHIHTRRKKKKRDFFVARNGAAFKAISRNKSEMLRWSGNIKIAQFEKTKHLSSFGFNMAAS